MVHYHATGTFSGAITSAFVVLASWVCVFPLAGKAEAATSVTNADGGSIQTDLGYDIILNKESSLRREWVAVHDDSMAADLIGTPGVTTTYEDRGYRYKAGYSIVVHEPVVAIEGRFITFDVWGNRTRSLAATDIKDFTSGSYDLSAAWRLSSENEASEFYASVAYVASVRTKTGDVHHANPEAVIQAAQQYMSDFTSDLLDEVLP